eukprot:scaffold8590_cov85-Isochrysis_galbana.AAC.3
MRIGRGLGSSEEESGHASDIGIREHARSKGPTVVAVVPLAVVGGDGLELAAQVRRPAVHRLAAHHAHVRVSEEVGQQSCPKVVRARRPAEPEDDSRPGALAGAGRLLQRRQPVALQQQRLRDGEGHFTGLAHASEFGCTGARCEWLRKFASVAMGNACLLLLLQGGQSGRLRLAHLLCLGKPRIVS